MKTKVYVFGHKNPDTDSVCSAIAYAHFKNKTDSDNEFIPATLSKINNETAFVLKKFGFRIPKKLNSVKGKKVILVDHNHLDQTAGDINEAEILEVIDHHNIADLQTGKPILFHAEPVGSTATIIADFYIYHKVPLDKKIAGILLASILSDTVIFMSSTCTRKDKEMAEKLAIIAKLDSQQFGIEVKRAGADISKRKIKDILLGDLKGYDMNGKKVGISQVELFDLDELKKREKEILKEGEQIAKEYDLFCFMATDILNKSTYLYVFGNLKIVEKAFEKKGNPMKINAISRKLDVVPRLQKVYGE